MFQRREQRDPLERGVHSSTIIKTGTRGTRNLYEDSSPTKRKPAVQWRCSSDEEHNKHSPIFTMHKLDKETFKRNAFKLKDSCREKSVGIPRGDALFSFSSSSRGIGALLACVLKEKTNRLPSGFYMASNHVLINNTRVKYDILPLIRVLELDEMASAHAKRMACDQKCEHSDLEQLLLKVSGSSPCRRIGENVCRGKSVSEIHRNIITEPEFTADRNNMGDRRFSSFGVGAATCDKGEVYVCQIFKG